MMIDVQPGSEQEVHDAIKEIAGVKMAHRVTGEYDIIVFIESDPYHAFARVVDCIRKTSGVRDTDTQLVLH